MIPLEESVAILLCAGLSRRFGPANKLLAPLEGRPLAAHAASLCAGLKLTGRIAVVPPDDPPLDALLRGFGFDLVVNPTPEAGKDSSLRLGLAEGLARGARGLMVLLADMPHVEAGQLERLAAAADDRSCAISRSGEIISPPSFFTAAAARCAVERADRPARESLGDPVMVDAAAGSLADYDRPEDFC